MARGRRPARGRAGALVARRRTTSAPTASTAHARRDRRLDRGDAVLRGQGAPARGDPCGGQGRPARASCARRGRSSSRSSCSTTPRRRSTAPSGEPELEVAEGGVRTRALAPAARAGRDRRAVPDRRRPPPLRDGGRLPRAEEPSATHTLRRARLVARSRARDLPDPPRRAGASATTPFGFMTSTWDTGSLAMYREGNFYRLESDDELDTREVEQLRARGRRVHTERAGGGRGRRRRARADRVPRAAADGRPGLRVRRPRRDDAAEVDVTSIPSSPPACSSTRFEPAGSSCAGRPSATSRPSSRRCRRARSASGPIGRGEGRRRHDRARRGGRDGPCSRTSTGRASGSSPRRSGSGARAR